MKQHFHTTKERIVIDKISFDLTRFCNTLNAFRPKEIFNSQYSENIPCWIITEYLEGNRVKYYANGWADKTPIEESMENIHCSWKIQGLIDCFFNVA